MARIFGVFLCLVAAAGIGAGQCRHVVRSNIVATEVVTNAAVVATNAVVAPVAVPVVVPAYGASYTPPCDTEALTKGLKAVEDRLAALEAKIGQLQAPAAPPVAPQPPPPGPTALPDPFNPPKPKAQAAQPAAQAAAPVDALPILVAKCAQCHDAAKADASGGGFAFLQGGKAMRLDARGLLRVVSRSYAGTMPPKKSGIAPLSDEEVAAVLSWTAAQKDAR